MTTYNPRLTLAGNSIGNPKDIPSRSLEALKSADLLVFEEDRGARVALKNAGIQRPYLKFSEHKQEDTLEEIKQALIEGKWVNYMSDQGMPTLADPGAMIVELAYHLGAKVQVIPGPSSITAALSACPFLENSFHYAGFLPRDEKNRVKELSQLLKQSASTIILDTPYRLKNLLESTIKSSSKDRMALLALDISGPKENYIFDSLEGLLLQGKKLSEKLNFVLIVRGAPTQKSPRGNKLQRRNKGKK